MACKIVSRTEATIRERPVACGGLFNFEDLSVLTVFVYKALTGERLTEVRLQPSDPVSRLQQAAAQAAQVGLQRVSLLFGSRPLIDGLATLASVGLSDGVGVDAVVTVPGRLVLTASADGTARLWRAEDGTCLQCIDGHEYLVTSACFSPDGSAVATASLDGFAKVWRLEDGSCSILDGQDYQVLSASFSPDGGRVITAPLDETAKIWCAKDGSCLAMLRGHRDVVLAARFAPDGETAATRSADGTTKIWSVPDGQCLQTLWCGGVEARLAIFSSDGLLLLTSGSHQTALLWRREGPASCFMLARTLSGHEAEVSCGAFSLCGSLVAIAAVNGSIKICAVGEAAGQDEQVLHGHASRITGLAFSPDASLLVSTASEGAPRLWCTRKGTCVCTLEGHDGEVHSATFSPDGSTVLTSSADGTARLWFAEDGSFIRALVGHGGGVLSACFSP